MKPYKFCSECGRQCPTEDTNFCGWCGTKRGLYLTREEYLADMERVDRERAAQVYVSSSSSSTGDVPLTSSASSIDEVPLTSRSTVQENPPSYEQIFKPPPNKLKKPNKLYGKKALRENSVTQHKRLLDNYRKIKKWIVEGKKKGVLPDGAFNLEDNTVKKNLHQIIEENHGNLKPIKVKNGKDYTWEKEDIYKKMKQQLKYLRQKERRQQRRHADTVETSGGRLSPCPGPMADNPPRVKIELDHQHCGGL